MLCCIIGISVGIISERNYIDGNEWYHYSHLLSNSVMWNSLSWVTGCLVSTETCFTFPLVLGLSIYFEYMWRRHYPFWQWMLRKLPWLFVIRNKKKEAHVYVTSVHAKSTSWRSSLLAIETVWRKGVFYNGETFFFFKWWPRNYLHFPCLYKY